MSSMEHILCPVHESDSYIGYVLKDIELALRMFEVLEQQTDIGHESRIRFMLYCKVRKQKCVWLPIR